MTSFVLVKNETWRASVSAAVGDARRVRFFTELSAALEAHRGERTRLVILELGAFPEFELAAFGSQDPPALLCLLADAAEAGAALRAGATDCELSTEPSHLALRLEVLQAHQERTRRLRADAGVLEMMVATPSSGWRFWEFDMVGKRFTRAPPTAGSAHGYSLADLEARSWEELYPQNARRLLLRCLRDDLERYKATGELRPRSLDLEINNADGSTGFRRITLTLGFDAEGKPTIVRGVTCDITDSVRTRSSLASIEASVAALLATLPIPIISLDADGMVKEWNLAAEHAFGFQAAEVLGRPYPLCGTDETGRSDRRLLLDACRGGLALKAHESMGVRRDGVAVHIAMWTGPIADVEGRLTGTFVIVADIDERKRAELEYRRLFESAHDAILVFDPADEIVLDVNARGCEIYGRSRDELVGSSLRALSATPDRGREKIQETLQSGALLRFETVQYRKDGSAMILDVNASAIEYRGKTAILSINRDVTEHHAHQEELRKRDRALAEASKLEAVGRLAGGIAHDFNNLLMVIESCSQVLAEAQDDSQPTSDEVVDLEDAVARAKMLVRQLVTFARQAPVQIQTLDLCEVVGSLRGILRRLLREDIELITDVELRTPLYVQMDPSQLEQVIVNLVVNARDAIASVGTVSIDVEPSAKPGFVELIVRDDGNGMGEVTQAQIFEPFFTTKEPGKGTGLGLATVHGIVSAAGGEIAVESQPEIGTEFRVLLPIAAQPKVPASTHRKRSRLSQPGAESILLVEDERAVRRILSRELKKYGYLVLESDDGAAALEFAASHPYPIDLLITDVVMPHMGGGELAKRLRSSRPDLKVVFMSGHTDRRAVQEIAETGFTVLSKPFAPAQLMETVRGLFTVQQD